MLQKIYDTAKEEMGVAEIEGEEANPRILQYFAATGAHTHSDETAWCAAFVSFVLEKLGIPSTKSAWSRSYLTWGKALDRPVKGCVVVFTRPPDPAKGHVAFFVTEEADKVYVLGGNQGNRVTIAAYPKSRVLAYRGPIV